MSLRKQSIMNKHKGSQRTSSSAAFCSDGEMVLIATDGGNSTCNVGGVISRPKILESEKDDPEVITVDSKSEHDYYSSYQTPQVIQIDDSNCPSLHSMAASKPTLHNEHQ